MAAIRWFDGRGDLLGTPANDLIAEIIAKYYIGKKDPQSAARYSQRVQDEAIRAKLDAMIAPAR